MLPQTPLDLKRPVAHESINYLTVHKATLPQIFHPVSESRHFTRAEAGEAFERGLLPADQRIPHPELVDIERDNLRGVVVEERLSKNWAKANARDAAMQRAVERRKEREREATKVVRSGRWEFRFRDVVVDGESVGRHVEGTGFRYGVPPQDRKKGQVKIPTRVE